MKWVATHHHEKSGKNVDLFGYGRYERDLTPVAVYLEETGHIWVRDRVEFDDGRFVAYGVPAAATIERAWVIEDRASSIDRPLYFTRINGVRGNFQWSYDHNLAVRFSRRRDAEALADVDVHRVCEHAWDIQNVEAVGTQNDRSADGQRSATLATDGTETRASE